jgi:hypothetical protein
MVGVRSNHLELEAARGVNVIQRDTAKVKPVMDGVRNPPPARLRPHRGASGAATGCDRDGARHVADRDRLSHDAGSVVARQLAEVGFSHFKLVTGGWHTVENGGSSDFVTVRFARGPPAPSLRGNFYPVFASTS